MNKSLTEFSSHLDGIQEVLENRNDQFVKDLKAAKFDITQENNQMKGSCCDDDLRIYLWDRISKIISKMQNCFS